MINSGRSSLVEISPDAKLICGLIGKAEDLSVAEKLLCDFLGEADTKSEAIDFVFTDYYEEEMGWNLVRKWISLKRDFTQPEIVRTKLKTIGVERELAFPDGRRRVNLDPGYVTGSKLVLASTKDFSHRIYLWGGIFAEVTLLFEHGSFVPLRWTYPDYRTNTALLYFKDVRRVFLGANAEAPS
jgi:hypothetical protein